MPRYAGLMAVLDMFTDVGRNDRCPCGSGQKFKYCCFTLVEEPLQPIAKNVGAYLGLAEMWPRSHVTLDSTRALIRAYDALDLVQMLAKTSLVTHEEFFAPNSLNEALLLRLYLDPVLHQKARLWLQSGKRGKVIHRLLMPAAIRLAMIESTAVATRQSVSDLTTRLGELLLSTNTILEPDFERRANAAADGAERRRVLCAGMVRLLFYSHRDNDGTAIGRTRLLLGDGLDAVRRRYANEYLDFEAEFAAAFGFPYAHVFALALGIIGHYRGVTVPKLTEHPEEFRLGINFFRSLKPEIQASVQLCLDYLSRPWSEYVQLFASQANNSDSLLNLLPFYERPLLEVDARVYCPIDMPFLNSAVTEGAFWSLLLRLIRDNRTADAGKLKAAVGHAAEWHVVELLRPTFDGKTACRIWTDWDGQIPEGRSMPTPDLVILDGTTLFVLEVTSSAIRPSDAVSCDPERIERGLSELWFGRGEALESAKLRQLEGSIQGLQEGRLQLAGLDMTGVKHIVPVLVSLRHVAQAPPLWAWYRNLIRDAGFSETFVQAFHILTVSEIEKLALMTTSGASWERLFLDWDASGEAEQGFTNYLAFNGKDPGRHPLLQESMRAAFNEATQLLFGTNLIPPSSGA